MSYKSGVVGIVGLPNAGKSTLVNALVGEKVSIVTSKPQTTRKRVTGIVSEDNLQAILTDAPGFLKSEAGLNGFLSDEAKSVIEDVESLIFVISLSGGSLQALEEHLKLVRAAGKPVFCLLNKLDEAKPTFQKEVETLLDESGLEFLRGSLKAKTGRNEVRAVILNWLSKILPETGAPLYDPEIYTTQNMRDLAEEVIREAAFERLHQEIPFGLGVKIVKFDESSESLTRIYAEVWVNRDSHKGIVVGAGASSLKAIGIRARARLEEFVGTKVFLDLRVKVKKNWIKNDHMLQELGYVLNSK
ncbi:MAG: GTPase Era [Bdellovibrionales bacterium]|nr:GTPase Era [Bdellovibrionales bacterium]